MRVPNHPLGTSSFVSKHEKNCGENSPISKRSSPWWNLGKAPMARKARIQRHVFSQRETMDRLLKLVQLRSEMGVRNGFGCFFWKSSRMIFCWCLKNTRGFHCSVQFRAVPWAREDSGDSVFVCIFFIYFHIFFWFSGLPIHSSGCRLPAPLHSPVIMKLNCGWKNTLDSPNVQINSHRCLESRSDFGKDANECVYLWVTLLQIPDVCSLWWFLGHLEIKFLWHRPKILLDSQKSKADDKSANYFCLNLYRFAGVLS